MAGNEERRPSGGGVQRELGGFSVPESRGANRRNDPGPLARWEAVRIAASSLGLSDREHLLLDEIARRDGGTTRHCCASQGTLARDLGWHRQKVSEVMRALLDAGAVEAVGVVGKGVQILRFPWWRFPVLSGNPDRLDEGSRGLPGTLLSGNPDTHLSGNPDTLLSGNPDTEQEGNRKRNRKDARERAQPAMRADR